ncbi:MAG: MBL fold metallo-hydrolase [Candidatus Hodarchaeota archaeon]
MPEKKSDSQIFKELFSIPLEKQEAIFAYFGWAGIVFRTEKHVIAIDMGEKCFQTDDIPAFEKLNLQLYSHTHWDHFSLPVTKKIFETTEAPVIAEPQVASELKNNIPADKLFSPNSGETIVVDEFEISAVSGVHPRPITLFRVKWDECSFFHGADSGYVPLEDYSADLAFIPTGSPSPSCSPEKGLKMVLDIKPRIIVAMHGNKTQMRKFEALTRKNLPDVEVILPDMKEPIKLSL